MYVAVDPDRLEDLAGRCDRTAEELDSRARSIAAALDTVGHAADAPAIVRAVAAGLRAGAADARRRAGAARREQDGEEGLWSGLWRFLSGDVAGLWSGEDDDSMPWGAWLAGLVAVGRTSVAVGTAVLKGTDTVVPYGLARRAVETLPGMGWVASPVAGVVLKRVSIAAGVYGGVRGTIDLVRQGSPVQAYRREGAGYVADVAETAFQFSSSAFLAAPNPVTGAAVVGSGATWLGAEAWDHRDEIADTWDAATDWAGDRLDDAGDAAGDVADLVSFWN